MEKDACPIADNVEFFYSTLGERRAGCEATIQHFDMVDNPDLEAAVWMHWHTPDEDPTHDELWVLTVEATNVPVMYRWAATGWLYRFSSTGWSIVTWSSDDDTPDVSGSYGTQIYGQSLNGKLYLAFKSVTGLDRLHVWDGRTIRRVGLKTFAAAPTAADDGGVGTYAATLRYYRTRSVEIDAADDTTVRRRSEPSASVSFTPNGNDTGVVVTRPTLIDEGETHWEVEVSLDDATFYRLSRVARETATYTDSAATTTYADNTQSDAVGSYLLIPSAKFLATDAGRLMIGGSWETPDDSDAIQWTPQKNDPLPAADERLDDAASPRVDLDTFEGGEMSGLAKNTNGNIVATKREHIYRLARTGQLVGAYEVLPALSKSIGAYPRSLVEAVDEGGRPALYFLDPESGPSRYGVDGIQGCSANLRTLWRRINKSAIVPCHGVYYADKLQIHYWLALDSSNYPNVKIILQTNQVCADAVSGAQYGWSTAGFLAENRIAVARCSTMFHSNIELPSRDLSVVPFIGKAVWTVLGSDVTEVIQRCDVGTTDADSTGDTDSDYLAKIRTRPFFLTGILNHHEVLNAAILGIANTSVKVTIRGDFGKTGATDTVTADFTAVGSETHVIDILDDLEIAELSAVDIQFEDATSVSQWQLFQFAMKVGPGQSA